MIVLMGVSGSGKGEQGDRLIKKLGIPRISTSQILRETDNPKIRQKILQGILVSDDEMIALLEEELKKINPKNSEFILDGAPRSIPQAEWLVKKIKSGEVKLTAVINLNVSKEVVLKRLLNRDRDDDKEESILRKFKEYDQKTRPVLDYLKQNSLKVDEVDADAQPEEVEQRIARVLETK